MKIQFSVNTENIIEFADVLSENNMENQIAGSNEDGNLLIDVFYSKENRECIEELEDLSESN